MPPAAALECDRTGMDLGHDRHRRARASSRQGGPLTGETGADDQHVVRGHGRTIYGDPERDVRYEGARRACSARDTWSSVTTPRRRPSASTAISAPRRRSGSEPTSDSSGVSVRTCSESATSVADRHARRPPAARRARPPRGGRARRSARRPRRPRTRASPGSAGRTRRTRRSAVSSAGIVTGSASMMSPAVMPSRRVTKLLWAIAARADAAEHPAQHEVPEPAEGVVARDQQVDAVAHHQPGEGLAEVGGELRRAVAVAGELPDDGARDAAAVERERGDMLSTNSAALASAVKATTTSISEPEAKLKVAASRRAVAAEHRQRGGGEDDRQQQRHGRARRRRRGTPRPASRSRGRRA